MLPGMRDDFEVTIICALPSQAAAVLNSFDQRYDKNDSEYGKQEGDTDTYSTGRLFWLICPLWEYLEQLELRPISI